MKLLLAFCVLGLIALSSARPEGNSRGCIYILGNCYRECEEGTHSYSPGCGPITPEPTCEEPNPKKGEGDVCDYTGCYCDSPTVRDTISRKCVPLEQCPKKKTE